MEDPAIRWTFAGVVLWLVSLIPCITSCTMYPRGNSHIIALWLAALLVTAGLAMIAMGVYVAIKSEGNINQMGSQHPTPQSEEKG